MYKYFISYQYQSGIGNGFGDGVIETTSKINSFEKINSAREVIAKEVKQKKNFNNPSVVIINLIELEAQA